MPLADGRAVGRCLPAVRKTRRKTSIADCAPLADGYGAADAPGGRAHPRSTPGPIPSCNRARTFRAAPHPPEIWDCVLASNLAAMVAHDVEAAGRHPAKGGRHAFRKVDRRRADLVGVAGGRGSGTYRPAAGREQRAGLRLPTLPLGG